MAIAAEPHLNEEYTMPRTEALLAATLALMTGHVQSDTGFDRDAMAQKICTNLSALSGDPLLSPGFQSLLWVLCSRWQHQTQGVDRGRGVTDRRNGARSLWHHSPEAVQ